MAAPTSAAAAAISPAPSTIDRVGKFGLLLRQVDRRVSGGVDDAVGPRSGYGRGGAAGLVQVELGPADKFHLSFGCKSLVSDSAGKLAALADHQNLHVRMPSRSPRYLPSRIGRHHASLARNQSTVFSIPLSKLSVARQPSSRSILAGSIA